VHPADRVGAGSLPRALQRQRHEVQAGDLPAAPAARDLFVEQGYSATTVQQIAARADVAWQTVYSVFGTKAAILSEVFDVAVAGDDEPVALPDRPFVAAIGAAATRAEKARIFAAHLRETHGSTAPVLSVIEAAAAVDEEMAALWEKLQGQRLHGMTMAARDFAAAGALRPDRSEAEAADVLFLLTGPWAYRALVTGRGWDEDAYESWLADALQALVLGPDSAGEAAQ
jgi:TetR/AcrR family transcriptional regulator, regulator of autoinduction and epiphytic fitness